MSWGCGGGGTIAIIDSSLEENSNQSTMVFQWKKLKRMVVIEKYTLMYLARSNGSHLARFYPVFSTHISYFLEHGSYFIMGHITKKRKNNSTISDPISTTSVPYLL